MKKMSIGLKIGSVVGIVILLFATVAVISYSGIKHAVIKGEETIYGGDLQALIAARLTDHLRWVGHLNDFLNNPDVKTLDVELDPTQCGLGKWFYGNDRKEAERHFSELAPILQSLEAPHRLLHESARKIKQVFHRADPMLPGIISSRLVDHYNWKDKFRNVLLEKERDIDVQLDHAQCALGKWLYGEQGKKAYEEGSEEFKKAFDDILEPHKKLHEAGAVFVKRLNSGKDEEFLAIEPDLRHIYDIKMVPVFHGVIEHLNEMKAAAEKDIEHNHEAIAVYNNNTTPNFKEVQKFLSEAEAVVKRSRPSDTAMVEIARSTQNNVSLLSIIAILFGIILSFMVIRTMTRTLLRILGELIDGSRETAQAASEVSMSSQQVSQGATEQAASIEETTSALDEVKTAIGRNADNAKQADQLAMEARSSAELGDTAMTDMKGAMSEINEASMKISKIIKSIEEIAFQTNILALNAAVEAARAGEHGKGFAVVAEEVRNLAKRSAEAAQETAGLIADSVSKTGKGSSIVNSVAEALRAIVDSSKKVATVVSEIATESSKQAEGASQVTNAMTQMDQVVQQNASAAEQAASAAEELSSQASVVKGLIGEMEKMIKGSSTELSTHEHARLAGHDRRAKLTHNKTHMPLAEGKKPGEKHGGGPKVMKPDDIIPFDEDEMKEF